MKYFCILALLISQTTFACVNLRGATLEGTYEMSFGESHVDILRTRMASDPSSKLKFFDDGPEYYYEFEVKFPEDPDDEERAAIEDLLTGNYTGAIEKLTVLEEASPGNYRTAANLGTAYELAGDNGKALHWIEEGIKRNERSHYGTEWLHVEILEAKIAMESDPDYLKTRHILNFSEDELRNGDFIYRYKDREIHQSQLFIALHYQLAERMLFVKPTDPIVADLLYSFAVLEANIRVLEPAVELLELATEYGYHDLADIDERLVRYQGIIDSTPKTSPIGYPNFVLVGALFLLLLLLGFLILRSIYRLIRPPKTLTTDEVGE